MPLGGGTNGNWQWITTAFEMAHEHCPNAILILNDFNNIERDNDANHFIGITQAIMNGGAPIDAVGAQAHDLDHGSVSLQKVQSLLQKLHDDTGLPIYITEFDISTTNDQSQLQTYEQYFPLFDGSRLRARRDHLGLDPGSYVEPGTRERHREPAGRASTGHDLAHGVASAARVRKRRRRRFSAEEEGPAPSRIVGPPRYRDPCDALAIRGERRHEARLSREPLERATPQGEVVESTDLRAHYAIAHGER